MSIRNFKMDYDRFISKLSKARKPTSKSQALECKVVVVVVVVVVCAVVVVVAAAAVTFSFVFFGCCCDFA